MKRRVIISCLAALGLMLSVGEVIHAAKNGSHDSAVSFFSNPGVDYAPNHFESYDKRNDEDQANVYLELKQLKAAGFNTVRMYGPPAKTWIAVIKAAAKLQMNVVYQIALCQSNPATGNTKQQSQGGLCVKDKYNQTYDYIAQAAYTQLKNVIANTNNVNGNDLFKQVVKLVIVGNEVLYTNSTGAVSNAANIADSIKQVQTILKTSYPDIPITISLQADVWMGGDPASKGVNYNALATITKALPNGAPIAINVYPFQWKTTFKLSDPKQTPIPMTPALAFNAEYKHSLPQYVNSIGKIYNRSVIISETGWATHGEYCLGENCPVCGRLDSATQYYSQLYNYAKNNSVPLLTFMAFDQPTKEPLGDVSASCPVLSTASKALKMSSENYYGVFDHECNVKVSAVGLLPNQAFSNYPVACNSKQSIFTISGMSNKQQPPYWIKVTRGQDSFVVAVPTKDRTQKSITPWPTISLEPGDVVTVSNQDFNSQGGQRLACQNTVGTTNTSTAENESCKASRTCNSGGTWINSGAGHGGAGCNTINWAAGQNVFLPGDFGKVTKNTVIIAPGSGVTGSFVVANQSPIDFSGPKESLAQVSDGQAVTLVVNCGSGKQLTCQGSYSKGVLILNSPSLCANKYASGVNWDSQERLLSLALPPPSACN